MMRVYAVAKKGFGFALLLAAMSSSAFAVSDVPEIDAGSAASALALLSAGVLMLKEKFSSK